MKACKWYLILLPVIALVLSSLMPACGQPEQQSTQADENLRQIEEQSFSELYNTMKRHIEHTHTLALGLQNFEWVKLANVGWEYKDQYGISRFKRLPEFLPSAEAIKPALTYYDEYCALAVKVWQENPYKEHQTAVEETKRLTIPQWREMCAQLELQLGKAEIQAQDLKSMTDKQFSDVERILTSETWLEHDYLEGFQNDSAQYANSLNEAISNLGQAKQAASELKNWQFKSLAPQEGAIQTLPVKEEEAQTPPTTEGVAPEAKKLQYEDDFSNPYSGWPRLSSEETDLDYQDGEYHITVKKFTLAQYVYNRNAGRFADFVLEVDARLVSGPNGGGGLVFRAQDLDNCYCFLVQVNGYYYIGAVLSGMWLSLQPKKHSDLINIGNSTNHLKVICKGSKIELYVNGHYLTAITDNYFTDGYVGMIVDTPKPDAHFAFDNFKVQSSD